METIPTLIDRAARSARSRVAITAPARAPLSYERLSVFLSRITAEFDQIGVDRKRRVALALPIGPEAVVASLAVTSRAIAVPLNPNLRRPEFESCLARLKVDCLLAQSKSVAAEAAAALNIPLIALSIDPARAAGEFVIEPGVSLGPAQPARETLPDDVAVVMHTSGTTGQPKRVPLTHANLCASARCSLRSMALDTGDRLLAALPTYHIAGIGIALAALAAGSGVCCAPGFYGVRFVEWMDEYRPTWIFLAPAALGELVEFARGREAVLRRCPLRFIRSGSVSVPPSLLAEAEDAFQSPVIEVYGMTEAAPLIACSPLPPAERKPGSVGLPVGPEVMVLGDGGRPAQPGQRGEILIRGPNVMQGYEDDPEANREAFLNGWFRTGDVGSLDAGGYLFIVGRIREMINRGGEKVFPREVEDVLLSHAAVAEAAAFPTPHERLSEDVAAAVVLRNGATATERELRLFVSSRLAGSKVPARILLTPEIPKGPGGKLQRANLAAHFGLRAVPVSKSGRPPFVAPSSPTEQVLAEIWSRVLNIAAVGIHDDFFQLGGDSFAAATLLVEVQKEFNASAHLLETIDFLDSPTIAHVSSILQGGSVDMPGVQAGPGHPSAVALQPRGSNPALFMVPGAGENSIYLLPLARHLGQERPFYALRDPRRAGERGLYSLEDVAERYVQAVRAVQPHGPYLLAGHCLGGVVAFEMAQCLVAAGEQVSLLALIETGTPHYPNFTSHWFLYLAELHRQLVSLSQGRISAGRLLEGARALGRHIWSPVQTLLERLKVRGLPGRPVRPAISIEQANLRAVQLYMPGMYPGRIAIVCVEDHLQTGSLLDRRLGWRELAAGGVEVHLVPGGHFTSLIEPDVRELAARLRTLADRGICASGSPRNIWKTLGRLCDQAGLGDEPRKVFAELQRIALVDVVMPTRPGSAIRKRCISRPTEHRRFFCNGLGCDCRRTSK